MVTSFPDNCTELDGAVRERGGRAYKRHRLLKYVHSGRYGPARGRWEIFGKPFVQAIFRRSLGDVNERAEVITMAKKSKKSKKDKKGKKK
ncbi:hypothetical protein Dvina_26680 [Dactylosporangium vinaceum]|uniref:Uncharacterized protein n=1 Tax=Dactylosporangium vinaceum TaxID=53362 RepID=A0ABV5MBU2_9ACTN|nr:hypothetical protein [Dactylosporangium vinaceum]UAC01306.1 hypothetical protein Dvina_26680 [Dactylosporangium vinaceum]